MYHALDEQPSPIAIRPAVFAWQMRWLHEHGYRAIPLSRLVQCLHRNEPLPQRAVVITFDDGFESIYTAAFPILAEYGFAATVFLVTGYCGRQNDWPHQPLAIPCRPLLAWPQIRQLHEHGIEFGAHTITHPWLDRLAPADIEREVLASKAAIEDQLGHAVHVFAYPYGRYTPAVRAIVGRAFSGACSTRLGLVESGSDPLALERIEMLYLTQPMLFQWLAHPSFSFYLDLRRMARATAGTLLGRPWQ